jgi:hypothetical protein
MRKSESYFRAVQTALLLWLNLPTQNREKGSMRQLPVYSRPIESRHWLDTGILEERKERIQRVISGLFIQPFFCGSTPPLKTEKRVLWANCEYIQDPLNRDTGWTLGF